ncbi:ATP-binding protein, partial [candidate division KSB1 bacterium]
FIRWFTVNQTYLIISRSPQIFEFFSERERRILTETKIEFIFPLIVMNRITGLICLSKKVTGEEIGDDVLEMLTTLLGQSALAFENAYLYQQQQNRLKRMYRADRLATLGQLSAGAAHEIRNPLTSIRSTIQYLKKSFKDEENIQLVNELMEEVDRINDIIEGLLSFSKPGKPLKENINLNQVIQQTIHLVETGAKKKNINIEFNSKTQQNELIADPSQLKQVFLNIIMNATQAIERDGKIDITLEKKKKYEKYSDNPENYFFIIIQDNGEGIPMKNIEHIFDPFFTTKKDGTGLGLSISYSIVQQHGGEIEIESISYQENENDHGSKVTITLPAL